MRAFGVPVAVVLVAIFSAILPAPVVALDNLITLTGQWVDDRGNDNYFLHVNGNTIKIVLCPECQTQISFEGEIYENHFYGKYIE